MEEYRTVARESRIEFTERRSHFIGRAKPVESEEEALAFLHDIRSECWDATHNVYAYCLRSGQIRRFSDDGEPQGTAGIPVLDVLVKSGLTDVIVVVTRYFGGILLGAGGLVRAYSHGASLAVGEAGGVTMQPCVTAKLKCTYSEYGKVAALIPEAGGTVEDAAFTDSVEVSFHMERAGLPLFEQTLADATRGQCLVQVMGEEYFRK